MATPLTATHKSRSTNIAFRVNNEEFADVYANGRWEQSSVPNEDILSMKRLDYVTVLSEGFSRSITNLFQWTVGSTYRVKKLKKF